MRPFSLLGVGATSAETGDDAKRPAHERWPMPDPSPAPDPAALLRSPAYVRLLVLAGLIGVPISAVAYFYLKLVDVLQKAIFTDLPQDVLGFNSIPGWWPLPVVA